MSVGRLEDDRVPADERGRDLPRRDRDREVPRRDHADDADRHAHAHVELVAAARTASSGPTGGGPRRPCSSVMSIASWTSPPASAFTLPISLRHQVGRARPCARVDELREAEEDLAALRRRHEPPVLERLLRGRDRAVDVLGAGLREDAERLARRRARCSRRSRRRRRRPTRRRCSS